MFFYLGEQATGTTLPEEWADLLQVGAVADVLKVRAFLQVDQVGASVLAEDNRATLAGELVFFLGKEGASFR